MVRRHSSQQRASRRTAFLDAAVTVVRRDGHTASMEAMAREAGVTKPILYRVFGDRSGLLLAVGERFADDIARALAEAMSGSGDPSGNAALDSREVLRASIDAYLTLVDRDPELYRFLTARLAADPSQPIATFIDAIARNITLVLSEQFRAIGADTGRAEPWAYALVGMVHMTGDWWLNRRTMTRDALVDALVELVWNGLIGLAPDGAPPYTPVSTGAAPNVAAPIVAD